MSAVLRAPSRSDVALSSVLTTLSVAELFTTYAFERTTASGPASVHLAVVGFVGASLTWRRVLPLLVAPFVFALLAFQPLVVVQPNTYGEVLISIIALYSLAVYAPSWRSATVPGFATAVLAVLLGLQDPQDPFGEAVTVVVFGSVVVLAGVVVRRSRGRADEMQRQRDVADQRAREIAATERARIARELHDVVAHGMSVVILQARGGRRKLEQDPRTARGAFDAIEGVATNCLDEMRRLLGILRENQPVALPLSPQPKLHELEGLVEQARASGATVDLVVEGEPRELAPAIELSAYRIAQEALTNALKHAPGSTAHLRLRYEADAVAIEVVDDGPGMRGDHPGHGLIGMRERVELFGGAFDAGTEPGGGFGVRARLPLPEPAT